MDKTSTWKYVPYNTTVDLLPCPFCGKNPDLINKENSGWKVVCKGFDCVEHRYGHETIESAVADWNRRKPQ